MALEVIIVSGSGQEHAGCLLLTSEVLFVVSLSEDTQQQAFPITEVTTSLRETGKDDSVQHKVEDCSRNSLRGVLEMCYSSAKVERKTLCPPQVECQQEPDEQNQLTLTLQQQTVTSEAEVSPGT